MKIVLWFILGLVATAAISVGALRLFNWRADKERPLPPEKLPKDWDSVMPSEKPRPRPKSAGAERSFRKVGTRGRSTGGSRGFK